MKNRLLKKIILVVVILAISSGYKYFQKITAKQTAPQTTTQHGNKPTLPDQQTILNKIRKAADTQQSGWWLSTQGTVIKTLKDDTRGHQHQRFLLKLAPDITLLVAHNIDLAPRVPLKKGDTIRIHGRYEWNHRGGVIHWTHHDPKGRRKSGWIYHKNKYYQ